MATHSSILAWRIPWTDEPGWYSPWGCRESDMTERLTLSLSRHILYPFLCRWTFRLLPCLGCYKQHCSERWAHICFQSMVFSGYIPRSEIARSHGSSIFSF